MGRNIFSERERERQLNEPTLCIERGSGMRYTAALVALSLLPTVTSNPSVKNKTLALLAPGADPCAIDPALCAPGASQESESSEADCSSHIRRGSVMLNLHARAAALQTVHAVVVFPGSSETERVRAALHTDAP